MSEELDRDEIRRRVRERAGKPPLPGPSGNPATNLLLADIVTRMGTYLLRGSVKKAFLSKRYDAETAEAIEENRSTARTLAAIGVAKFGTRSLPGALIVGTGILGKVLYDHSKSRRANRREGNAQLLERADEDS
jgi:hypothetical protein